MLIVYSLHYVFIMKRVAIFTCQGGGGVEGRKAILLGCTVRLRQPAWPLGQLTCQTICLNL